MTEKLSIYCNLDLTDQPSTLTRFIPKHEDGAFCCYIPVPIPGQILVFSEREWVAENQFNVILTYKDDDIQLGKIDKSNSFLMWKRDMKMAIPESMLCEKENGLAKLVVKMSGKQMTDHEITDQQSIPTSTTSEDESEAVIGSFSAAISSSHLKPVSQSTEVLQIQTPAQPIQAPPTSVDGQISSTQNVVKTRPTVFISAPGRAPAALTNVVVLEPPVTKADQPALVEVLLQLPGDQTVPIQVPASNIASHSGAVAVQPQPVRQPKVYRPVSKQNVQQPMLTGISPRVVAGNQPLVAGMPSIVDNTQSVVAGTQPVVAGNRRIVPNTLQPTVVKSKNIPMTVRTMNKASDTAQPNTQQGMGQSNVLKDGKTIIKTMDKQPVVIPQCPDNQAANIQLGDKVQKVSPPRYKSTGTKLQSGSKPYVKQVIISTSETLGQNNRIHTSTTDRLDEMLDESLSKKHKTEIRQQPKSPESGLNENKAWTESGTEGTQESATSELNKNQDNLLVEFRVSGRKETSSLHNDDESETVEENEVNDNDKDQNSPTVHNKDHNYAKQKSDLIMNRTGGDTTKFDTSITGIYLNKYFTPVNNQNDLNDAVKEKVSVDSNASADNSKEQQGLKDGIVLDTIESPLNHNSYLKDASDQDLTTVFHTCVICKTTFTSIDYFVQHLMQTHAKDTQILDTDMLKAEDVQGQEFWLKLSEQEGCKIARKQNNRKRKCISKGHNNEEIKDVTLRTLAVDRLYKANVRGLSFGIKDKLTVTQSGNKPFKCGVHSGKKPRKRGRVSTDKSSLTKYKRKHSGKKPYKCDVCGHAVRRSSELIRHKRIHTGEKPYKCDECGRAFRVSCNLTRHKRTHTLEKPYKCDECGRAFSEKISLTTHKRIHSGEKPYKCGECGKAFSAKSYLRNHKMTHTGEKQYKCDECGYATNELSNFNRHKKIHTGEKPYKCDECGKAFSAKSSLTKHKRTHTGEKPHTCDDCGRAFSEKSSLSKHKRIHTVEKPYKCGECGYAFSEKAKLTKHKRKHSKDKPYKCDVCGYAFKEKSKLTQHKRTTKHKRKHPKNKPYKCDVCGFAFYEKSKLIKHKMKHPRDKPYKCDVCGKAYCKKYTLTKHKIIIHNDERPHKCDVCGMAFRQTPALTIHKRTHIDPRPFKCDVCGFGFRTLSYLTVHIRKHTGEKVHKCDVCGKAFRKKTALFIHKRSHTGERPFECDVCGFAFRAKSSLVIHKRKHSGVRPYKCGICGKAFMRKHHFTNHKSIHTGEKKYKCDICEHAFHQLVNLITHKRIHTGEKPYNCDVCGKAFRQKTGLTTHKRIHTGEKPYKCDECGRAFSLKALLNIHKRIHTGEKPYQCDVCGHVCSQRHELAIHRRKHTGEKPYKCNVCAYACSQKAALNIHKIIHTGEKSYICEVCGYAFSHKTSLDKHKRIHSDEKPYKCDVCEYSCKYSGSLNIHKRKHSAEKPYLCDVCGRAFSHTHALNSHKKIHTDETPYK